MEEKTDRASRKVAGNALPFAEVDEPVQVKLSSEKTPVAVLNRPGVQKPVAPTVRSGESDDLTDHTPVRESISTPPAIPVVQSAGLRSRSLIKAANELQSQTPVTAKAGLQNSPTYKLGIIASLIMAAAAIVGCSEPLHIVFLHSRFNVPYLPGTMGFLDLYFVLLPLVVCYWSYSLFKISNSFSYKSALMKKMQRGSILLLAGLFNPTALVGIMVTAYIAMLYLSVSNEHLCAPILNGLWVIPIIPVLTTTWFHHQLRKISALRPAANSYISTTRDRLPALIVALCHVLPVLAFAAAWNSHKSVFLVAQHALTHTINPFFNQPQFTYDCATVSVMLFLGLFGAAISQAVAFIVLRNTVRGIDLKLRTPETKPVTPL